MHFKKLTLPSAGIVLGAVSLLMSASILVASATLDAPNDEIAATPVGTPSPLSAALAGLPIDTPPATEAAVMDSPPAGEEVQWQAVADWGRGACTFDGGVPDGEPVAMFKTTAGELRRRHAEERIDGTSLGSNWRNEDELFLVAYRGTFPHRPGPFRVEGEVPQIPAGDLCVYIGNGLTNPSDNGSVFFTTMSHPRDAIEDYW